jgi:hypothetical protein
VRVALRAEVQSLSLSPTVWRRAKYISLPKKSPIATQKVKHRESFGRRRGHVGCNLTKQFAKNKKEKKLAHNGRSRGNKNNAITSSSIQLAAKLPFWERWSLFRGGARNGEKLNISSRGIAKNNARLKQVVCARFQETRWQLL